MSDKDQLDKPSIEANNKAPSIEKSASTSSTESTTVPSSKETDPTSKPQNASSQENKSVEQGSQNHAKDSTVQSTAMNKSNLKLDEQPKNKQPPPKNAEKAPNSSTLVNLPPAKKANNRLLFLAILLGIAGIGIGSVNYQKMSSLENRINDNTQKIGAQKKIDSEIEKINGDTKTALETLQARLENLPKILNENEINQMIAAAVANIKAENATSEQNTNELKSYIDKEISKETTLLKKNLLSAIQSSNTPATGEVQKIQMQTIIAELDEHARKISQALTEQAETLSANIQQNTKLDANPELLVQALSLAVISAQNSGYEDALSYLDQAENLLSIQQLDPSVIADFASQINAVKSTLKTLVSAPTPAQIIDDLAEKIDEWPLRTNVSSKEAEKINTNVNSDSFSDRVSAAGIKILSKAFTVTRDDEADIAWINANPNLQLLIRENMRLDVIYARNAALLGNASVYRQSVTRIKEKITRYFQIDVPIVDKAIKTLDALTVAPPQVVTDLATLAAAVQNQFSKGQ